MTDPREPVQVFTASTLAEADLVRGLLLAHGIEARIADEGAVCMLDGVISGNRGVDVMVPGFQVQVAGAVIREARTAGGLLAAEAEARGDEEE